MPGVSVPALLSLCLCLRLQAVVNVDEEGTEAAATTAIMMVRMAFMPPEEMVFDRPFVFVLLHDNTSTPMFIGVVADPSSS
jgi:serpin B